MDDKTNIQPDHVQKPAYFGKPEHQRDPKAVRPHKDKRQANRQQNKQTRQKPANLPLEMPKGSQTHETPKTQLQLNRRLTIQFLHETSACVRMFHVLLSMCQLLH